MCIRVVPNLLFLFYYCIFILFIIIVCFVFCFVNSLSVFFFWCLFVLVCNILIIASNLVLDISVHLPLVLDKLLSFCVVVCCTPVLSCILIIICMKK